MCRCHILSDWYVLGKCCLAAGGWKPQRMRKAWRRGTEEKQAGMVKLSLYERWIYEYSCAQKQEFSLYRQRIFSNEKIRFIYSKRLRVLHEKHCGYVKIITDDDLGYSEGYLTGMRQCPVCETDAYLRLGAKDMESAKLYKKIFARCEVTPRQLRGMYVGFNMKTRVSAKGLTIWHREDTWKVYLLPEKGHVQLLHNNYWVGENGERFFTKGFHVQNPAAADTDFEYAFRLIRNYDYSPENAMLHKRAEVPQAAEPAAASPVGWQLRELPQFQEILELPEFQETKEVQKDGRFGKPWESQEPQEYQEAWEFQEPQECREAWESPGHLDGPQYAGPEEKVPRGIWQRVKQWFRKLWAKLRRWMSGET